jgi:hypothetical protein
MALRIGELLLLADDPRGGIPTFSFLDLAEVSRTSIASPSRYFSDIPSLNIGVKLVLALPTLAVLLFLGMVSSPT